MKLPTEYRSMCMAEALDLMRQEDTKSDAAARYQRRKAKHRKDQR